MKHRAVLISLSAVLAAVIISGIYITKRSATGKPGVESAPAAEKQNYRKVQISNVELDTIQTMELISDNGTLRFFREGENWRVEHPYPIKLDKSKVEDLLYSFGRLYSEKVIERNSPDLAVYGLHPRKTTARASLSDGSILEFYLGDRTPSRNTYYFMTRDDTTVYAVWMNHGEHFTFELEDVRQKNLARINNEEITYLKIARFGRPTIEIREISPEVAEQMPFRTSSYYLSRPYKEPRSADDQNVFSLFRAVPAFRIDKFVNDHPETLSAYGLERPSAELEVMDRASTIHLSFGSDLDNSHIYFQVAGEKAVYAMKKRQLEFMNLKPFELVNKFAFIVNIEYVDRILLKYGGVEHTISLSRTSEREETFTTYRVNDIEAAEDSFHKLYQSLIGLIVDTDHRHPVKEDPEVILIYYLNRGKVREYRISFTPFDSDFFAVFKNGLSEFLISRDQVRNMIADVEGFISKPE